MRQGALSNANAPFLKPATAELLAPFCNTYHKRSIDAGADDGRTEPLVRLGVDLLFLIVLPIACRSKTNKQTNEHTHTRRMCAHGESGFLVLAGCKGLKCLQ